MAKRKNEKTKVLDLGPRTFGKIKMSDGSTSYIGGTSPQSIDQNVKRILNAEALLRIADRISERASLVSHFVELRTNKDEDIVREVLKMDRVIKRYFKLRDK